MKINNFMVKSSCFIYLAQKLCIIFIGVYVSVCLSVCHCVCVCSSIISKSFQPILMKLDRMVYNDKISVPFEDEMNRSIRTEVTDNLLFQNRELRPFDNFFLVITSPFL